jgi:hypothetical protein
VGSDGVGDFFDSNLKLRVSLDRPTENGFRRSTHKQARHTKLLSTGRYIRSTWANSKGSEPPSAEFIAGMVALESVGAIGRA